MKMRASPIKPECYKAVLVVGPGSELGYNILRPIYDRPDCLIIGDGIRDISLEEIAAELTGKVDRNTRIDVEAHARADVTGLFLNLNYKSTQNITNSEDLLKTIDQCSEEPLHVEVRCCFGGKIKNNLKPGSVMITHSYDDDYLYEDVGVHSLAKLAVDHLQSDPKPMLDRITDNLSVYAMNPVKISIATGGGEVHYTVRHPKQLIVYPKNFLNYQMKTYYEQFDSLVGEETAHLMGNRAARTQIAPTPAEAEDYVYGAIVYQNYQEEILKFYNRMLDSHPEMLKSLLNKKIGRHDLILHALDEGQIEVVKFIVEHAAELTENTSQKTRLLQGIYRHALKKEDTGLLEALITSPHGIIKTLDGETLLTYSLYRKYDKVIKLLIDHKIGLDERNIKGMSAMDVVIKQMTAIDADTDKTRKQQLEQLLKAGADPDLKARDGLTPIFRAVELTDDPKIIDKLLSYSQDSHQKSHGDTLLDYAVKMKKKGIVDYLAKKADVIQLVQAIAWTHKVETPEIKESLLNQLKKKDKKIYQQINDKVYALIISPNNIDERGTSNLSKLIKLGNVTAVTAAINLGADVNLQSKAGSPLQVALSVPTISPQLIKMLVQAGADMGVVSPKGRSIAEIAKISGNSTKLEAALQYAEPGTINSSSKASRLLWERRSRGTPDQSR